MTRSYNNNEKVLLNFCDPSSLTTPEPLFVTEAILQSRKIPAQPQWINARQQIEDQLTPTKMSGAGQKRKFTGSSDGNKYKHSRRDDEIEQSHTQGKLDLIFGQRSVFPGLDDYTLTGDDTLDHDDELGALSYLRSVRYVTENPQTIRVSMAKTKYLEKC